LNFPSLPSAVRNPPSAEQEALWALAESVLTAICETHGSVRTTYRAELMVASDWRKLYRLVCQYNAGSVFNHDNPCVWKLEVV
jgi:hypothetical protein